LRDGTLDVTLPSGDGRRGGNLDLWFWLRARPVGKTDRLVLVPVLKARRLTTVARRSGLPTAIGLAVDRAQLLAALPGTYTINTAATVNLPRARTTIGRIRLPATTPVRIAVEEEVAAAADVILAQLEENELGLQIATVSVADVVESFEELVNSPDGIDATLASQDTVERLAQVHGPELDTERALTF
jgi:hypothetical protein